MIFAVIETGGKQYRVSEGAVLKVEKITDAEVGKEVVFDKVLLIDDGVKTQIGTPYIEGATITVLFEEEGKGKKIHGLKFKSKSRYTRRYGHRQQFAQVQVKKV